MKTKILQINPYAIDTNKIKVAARTIRNGGLVAFPTETVYGLGANAYSEKAVRKIFVAKGRPPDNPLIVHISSLDMLNTVIAELPPTAKPLLNLWPGPITLVLPHSERIPDVVTAGLDTVGVRMPNHPIALALIRESGVPIAAPSANLSGRPSPTSAEHVIDDLYGKVDIIIDGGQVRIGLESTVLDVTHDPPTVLRPGAITPEDLETILGRVRVAGESNGTPRSPGMKYRHYSPKAPLHVLSRKEMHKFIEQHRDLKIGIILLKDGLEHAQTFDGTTFVAKDIYDYALNMFGWFREFDKMGTDVILAEPVEEKGLGLAIMNRLRKAESNH